MSQEEKAICEEHTGALLAQIGELVRERDEARKIARLMYNVGGWIGDLHREKCPWLEP